MQTPGLWSTPSCSGITKLSMGPVYGYVRGHNVVNDPMRVCVFIRESVLEIHRDIEVQLETQTRVLQIEVGIGSG